MFSLIWIGLLSIMCGVLPSTRSQMNNFPVPETPMDFSQAISRLPTNLSCLSCKGKCGIMPNFKPSYGVVTPGCLCDEHCVTMGDCCPDFSEVCPELNENRMTAKDIMTKDIEYECYTGGVCWGETRYPLINNCPHAEGICERTPESIKTVIPVADTETGLHYSNALCALCNGARKIVPWVAKFYVNYADENSTEFEKNRFNSKPVTDDEYGEVIKLLREQHSVARFHPPSGFRPQRRCHGEIEVTRSCLKEWANDTIRTACEMGPRNFVSYKEHFGVWNFYNYFCAVCNGIDTSDLSCGLFKTSGVCGAVRVFSLEKLFSVNSDTGLSSNVLCKPGQTYIEQEAKCRNVKHFSTGEISDYFQVQFYVDLSVKELPYERAAHFISKIESHEQYNKYMKFSIGKCERQWEKRQDLLTIGATLNNTFDLNIRDISKNITYLISNFYNISVDNMSLLISTSNSSCKYIEYPLENIKPAWNGDVALSNRQVVKAGDYFISNVTLYVCTSQAVNSSLKDMFSDIVGWFTIIFMVLSIISLMAHLCLTFHFKSRGTHPMLTLTVCLLLSYISFLAAPLLVNVFYACYVAALVLHWSFMSSFCLMTATAADIYLLVSRSAKLLHVRDEGKCKKAIKTILPFLPSSILVLSALLIDIFNTSKLWAPLYAKGFCWINNFRGLLTFFVVPVGLCVLLTAVLTIISAIRLWLMTQNPPGAQKSRLAMFIKLSILTGLGWTFGFIAVPTNITALFIIFVILNASQGLFIFIVTWLPILHKKTSKVTKSSSSKQTTSSAI